MTCDNCEWAETCVFAVIDPKELCYKFKRKESEIEQIKRAFD